MGQGAGNACNQWVIGSNSLADTYLQKANGWTIRSPIPSKQITQHWKAFINNVNLFIGKPKDTTKEEFIQMTGTDYYKHWAVNLTPRNAFGPILISNMTGTAIQVWGPRHSRICNSTSPTMTEPKKHLKPKLQKMVFATLASTSVWMAIPKPKPKSYSDDVNYSRKSMQDALLHAKKPKQFTQWYFFQQSLTLSPPPTYQQSS